LGSSPLVPAIDAGSQKRRKEDMDACDQSHGRQSMTGESMNKSNRQPL